MTRNVFKYPIPVADTFTLDLPIGAQVLTYDDQGNGLSGPELKLWALVDPTASTELRTFRLAGTGHPIDGDVRYIGSSLHWGGKIVLHLFEVLAGATEWERR